MDTDRADLLQRLDRLESERSVRQLKAAYMQACDDKKGRAIADLFWPDGVWEGVGGSRAGRVVGHEAIADMFEASPRHLSFTVHYLTNESIEVDGDRAVGRWKLLEPCTYQDRQALWMGGHYVDVFERRGGQWRLLHLCLDVEFRSPYELGWQRQRHADLMPPAPAPDAHG